MAIRRYSPLHLISEHNDLRRTVSSSVFFGAAFQKERERYCAGHFGIAYSSAIAPCLIAYEEPDPQNHNDFYLGTVSVLHGFQITEVQAPGRRRGDEYRSKGTGTLSDERLDDAYENGPAWIERAISKKLQRYAGQTKELNLLVYVNFAAYQLEFNRVKIAAALSADKFRSVWLLTGNAVACIRESSLLGRLSGWYMSPVATNEA